MGWAKIDDGYATHPKMLAAGLEATGLDVRAISHCAHYGTDGFVSDTDVAMLAAGANARRLARRLVEVGRWERDDMRKGYVVHDYLEYNPSREDIEAERRRQSDRGRRAADARWNARRMPDAEGPPMPDAIQAASAEHAQRMPAGSGARMPRTRPLSNKSSSSHQGVGGEGAEEEEISTDEPDPTDPSAVAVAVALAIAERKLARRQGEPIANRSAWLRKAAANVLAESGALVAAMVADGETLGTIVATVDPEPQVEDGRCRGCGTPAGSAGHAAGCPEHVEWDLDEAGMAVRR